jgi:hypothetical protein
MSPSSTSSFVPNSTTFNRKETPIQTAALALLQVSSGEIWGRAHRQNGLFEVVQAYPNQLQAGVRGIEFTTPIAPDQHYSAPHEFRWYFPQTPGVRRKTDSDNNNFAVISAYVVNKQP